MTEIEKPTTSRDTTSESDEALCEDSDQFNPELPAFKSRARKQRFSVSAEVYGEHNKKRPFTPPKYPKTEDQRKRIMDVLGQNFMFRSLEEDDLATVLLAFTEKKLKKGDTLIKQGDDGDCLFLIESGEVDVFKVAPGSKEKTHLCVMVAGEAVGELALLYNCPRAATVVAKGDVNLWALDRECFNHIVKEAAARRREMYESFLAEVELLKDMDAYERSKLCDALKSTSFSAGEVIIKEGEKGDTFYIIESGECEAMKGDVSVLDYRRGDYFGELALIKDQPRAATVKTKTVTKCVHLDRKSFKRLLGPVEDILKRNAERYKRVQKELSSSTATTTSSNNDNAKK